jgi:uncharacterized protein (DUF58 family)
VSGRASSPRFGRWPRPTGLGIRAAVFYLVLWGAFLAAPYQNLAFGMLLFAGAIGVVAFFGNMRSLRRLRYVGLRLPIAPANEIRTIRLELGIGSLPIGWTLELRDEQSQSTIRFALDPERGTVQALSIEPQERGVRHFARASILSQHPFGLFQTRQQIDTELELVTPPSPWHLGEMDSGRSLDELLGLPMAQPGPGQPTSVRDFREGDDPKRLDWRATARRGDLVVKDHEELARPGGEVVLDRRCEPELLEDALSLVMGLAQTRRAHDEAFTLGTQGSLATYGADQHSWAELDRLLAELEVLPEDAPSPPTASPETLLLPRALTQAQLQLPWREHEEDPHG